MEILCICKNEIASSNKQHNKYYISSQRVFFVVELLFWNLWIFMLNKFPSFNNFLINWIVFK